LDDKFKSKLVLTSYLGGFDLEKLNEALKKLNIHL